MVMLNIQASLVAVSVLLASTVTVNAAPAQKDPECVVFKGVAGYDSQRLYPVYGNMYSDGNEDANRAVWFQDSLSITLITGKDSLPESVMKVVITAPNNKDSPDVYPFHMGQNGYCTARIDKVFVSGSTVDVWKGNINTIYA